MAQEISNLLIILHISLVNRLIFSIFVKKQITSFINSLFITYTIKVFYFDIINLF